MFYCKLVVLFQNRSHCSSAKTPKENVSRNIYIVFRQESEGSILFARWGRILYCWSVDTLDAVLEPCFSQTRKQFFKFYSVSTWSRGS